MENFVSAEQEKPVARQLELQRVVFSEGGGETDETRGGGAVVGRGGVNGGVSQEETGQREK